MKNLNVEALTNQRLKGFAYTPRGVYKLVFDGVITKSQALYYKFLLEVAVDWDKRHKSYGFIRYSQKELAQAYVVNASTVSKLTNALVKVGLLQVSEYGYLEISHYKLIDEQKRKKISEIVNLLDLATTSGVLHNVEAEKHYEHEINHYLSSNEVVEWVEEIANSEELEGGKSNFI